MATKLQRLVLKYENLQKEHAWEMKRFSYAMDAGDQARAERYKERLLAIEQDLENTWQDILYQKAQVALGRK